MYIIHKLDMQYALIYTSMQLVCVDVLRLMNVFVVEVVEENELDSINYVND